MTVLKDLAIRYGKKGFQVIGVNLTGAMLTIKHAARAMIDHGEGGALVPIAEVFGDALRSHRRLGREVGRQPLIGICGCMAERLDRPISTASSLSIVRFWAPMWCR